MKCICGYEQEEPFENFGISISHPENRLVSKRQVFESLFICPKCGTIRYEENVFQRLLKQYDIRSRRDIKPNICEILGVEIGEKFSYQGFKGIFYITSGGILVNMDDTTGEETLMTTASVIINSPDKIHKI